MLRRVSSEEDARAGWRLMREGFEVYRRFGIPGYRPPDEPEGDFVARVLAARAWGVVAEHEGEIVGVAAFEPALAEVRTGPPIPGLAHIFAVFVTEAHWGDGTATALLAASVGEIAAQGYAEARLNTPAAHARARRFYAREGWREVGAPVHVETLGLDMVEMRRPTRPGGRPTPSPEARP